MTKLFRGSSLAGAATGALLGTLAVGPADANPAYFPAPTHLNPGFPPSGASKRVALEPEPWIPRYGVSFQIGSGINSVDGRDGSTVHLGVGWEARLGLATRQGLTLELAYLGSLQDIDALGLGSTAVLVGNGAEAAFRLNPFGTAAVQPYGLVGIGVTRFRLHNETFNDANVSEADDVIHVPLGVGVVARDEGIIFDLRATMRPTLDDEQVARIRPPGIDREFSENLRSWSLVGSVGFEY